MPPDVRGSNWRRKYAAEPCRLQLEEAESKDLSEYSTNAGFEEIQSLFWFWVGSLSGGLPTSRIRRHGHGTVLGTGKRGRNKEKDQS